MKTPQRAIMWELWRTGRSDLTIRLLSLSLMALLFASVIANSSLRSSALQPIAGIMVLLLMICSALSSLWLQELDNQQAGFSLRLGFTRPVATGWLVTLPMLFGIATSVLCYAIPAGIFCTVLRTRLPMHAPMLLTAVINVGCLAAMWTARSRVEKFIYLTLLTAVIVGLVGWYVGEVSPGDSWVNQLGESANRSWSVLYDLIGVAFIMALIVVTVFAVDNQRHETSVERIPSGARSVESVSGCEESEFSGTLRLFNAFSRLAYVTGLDQRLAAQAGYELRRCGLVTLGAGLILPFFVFGLMSLIPVLNPRWNQQPLTWLVAIVFCPIVYQLIGIDAVTGLRGRQGRIDISPFDLIRPLRNDQLASVKLIVVACVTLAGWLLMLTAGVIYMVANYGTGWFASPAEIWTGMSAINWEIWGAGVVCLAMSIVSSSSMLLAVALWMDLYSWRLMALFGAVSVNITLVILDAEHGLRFRPAWTIEACILCFLIPLMSGLVIRKAWRSGTIGTRYLVLAFALWLLWAVSGYWLRAQVSGAVVVPFEFLVLTIAFLPVPLATTLTAPLAYASYRHR